MAMSERERAREAHGKLRFLIILVIGGTVLVASLAGGGGKSKNDPKPNESVTTSLDLRR